MTCSLQAWLALGTACVLAACEGSRDEIVGKWKSTKDQTPLEWQFDGDGRVLIANTIGRYTLGDGGRIKIQTPSATFVYQVEVIAKDRMILKDVSGTRTELERVR